MASLSISRSSRVVRGRRPVLELLVLRLIARWAGCYVLPTAPLKHQFPLDIPLTVITAYRPGSPRTPEPCRRAPDPACGDVWEGKANDDFEAAGTRGRCSSGI